MARGWESKSVEELRSDAADRRQDHGEARNPEQRETDKRRSSLELDRKRVAQEISATQSPARKAALETALAFLEEELSKLGPPEGSAPL